MDGKHYRYDEGQWFAVPLRNGGFGIGVIVRGSYATKGGLGYFFGPRYETVPGDEATWEKHAQQAVMITRFGDLGIINGRWPMIESSKPFIKENWPIPKFGIEVPYPPGKGFLREYAQNQKGEFICIKETPVDASDIAHYPRDAVMGGGAVEISLTNLLSQ